MKLFSMLLAILIASPLPVPASAEDVEASTSSVEASFPTEPLTVTAPRLRDQAMLETARATGAGVAAAGAGLMTYAVFFATGPFGWAAAGLFFGGMTAYLSHRRLQGKEDFNWSAPPPETAHKP